MLRLLMVFIISMGINALSEASSLMDTVLQGEEHTVSLLQSRSDLVASIACDVAYAAALGGGLGMCLGDGNRARNEIDAAINEVDEENERILLRHLLRQKAFSEFISDRSFNKSICSGAFGCGTIALLVSSLVRGYAYLSQRIRQWEQSQLKCIDTQKSYRRFLRGPSYFFALFKCVTA